MCILKQADGAYSGAHGQGQEAAEQGVASRIHGWLMQGSGASAGGGGWPAAAAGRLRWGQTRPTRRTRRGACWHPRQQRCPSSQPAGWPSWARRGGWRAWSRTACRSASAQEGKGREAGGSDEAQTRQLALAAGSHSIPAIQHPVPPSAHPHLLNAEGWSAHQHVLQQHRSERPAIKAEQGQGLDRALPGRVAGSEERGGHVRRIERPLNAWSKGNSGCVGVAPKGG